MFDPRSSSDFFRKTGFAIHFTSICFYVCFSQLNQDGRVVKALDLSSNGRMSAWVRSPLLVVDYFENISKEVMKMNTSMHFIFKWSTDLFRREGGSNSHQHLRPASVGQGCNRSAIEAARLEVFQIMSCSVTTLQVSSENGIYQKWGSNPRGHSSIGT